MPSSFFFFTISITAVQQDFRRKIYKNPPRASQVPFLGLSHYFTAMSAVALLVTTAIVTSFLSHGTKEFVVLIPR